MHLEPATSSAEILLASISRHIGQLRRRKFTYAGDRRVAVRTGLVVGPTLLLHVSDAARDGGGGVAGRAQSIMDWLLQDESSLPARRRQI